MEKGYTIIGITILLLLGIYGSVVISSIQTELSTQSERVQLLMDENVRLRSDLSRLGEDIRRLCPAADSQTGRQE